MPFNPLSAIKMRIFIKKCRKYLHHSIEMCNFVAGFDAINCTNSSEIHAKS